MKRISKILNLIYLVWTIVILTLIFCGKVTFGQGIGDFFYLVILIVSQIVFGYLFFKSLRNKIDLSIVIPVLQIIIVLLFTLKMTIWRGIEYPWNGNVFFE